MAYHLFEPRSALDENWVETDVKNALRANESKSSHVVCYALQGNGIDRADTAGCNGRGWRENVCYTLNTIDRPAVCYDARGNGDGIHSPTLTGDHENRITDYTTICVMAHGQSNAEVMENISPTITCDHEQSIIAMEGSNKGKGQIANDVSPCLKASHPSEVAYEANCRSKSTHAQDGEKPPRKYIIRRLTPLECNRLQGFPDGWGVLEHKVSMNEEEAAFWENVRKTRAEVAGKPYRPCANRVALLKWYNKLHTDSAEYRMWGNGIALPNAYFVISGCVEAIRNE